MSPKQLRSVAESQRHRLSIWSGAVRSGKTIASLLAFVIALAAAPNTGLIIICGRSLQTIERNILDPLADPALFGPLARHVIHTRGATTAVILGRTVHLIGASDARAEGRIRGATVYLAYADEITLMPEGFFNQLLARLSVPGARLLGTTNPDGPGHWLRKKFLLRADSLDLGSWHFTLDDNPALDPAYVAALKAEYVGLWYRRFILGEWCLAEGVVYDMWEPDRHVVTELPPIHRWLAVGVDHGTVNPFAAILLGLGSDGVLYAAAEWRHESRTTRRQMTDAEYSAAVRAWLAEQQVRPEYVVVDPSAASFIEQMHRDGVTPYGADNAVMDGIRTVSSLLGADRLRIHASCRGLISEFSAYAWDEKAAEAGDDKPVKAEDHSLDALRYSIRTTEALWRPYVPLAATAA